MATLFWKQALELRCVEGGIATAVDAALTPIRPSLLFEVKETVQATVLLLGGRPGAGHD